MAEAAPALGKTDTGTPPWLALAWRYGLSVTGPLAVSGAHFLVSLVFLRSLEASEFGIFSFVLVVSAFAMSVSGAGLVLPATHSMVKEDTATTAAVFRLALAAGLVFAVALTLATMASGRKQNLGGRPLWQPPTSPCRRDRGGAGSGERAPAGRCLRSG